MKTCQCCDLEAAACAGHFPVCREHFRLYFEEGERTHGEGFRPVWNAIQAGRPYHIPADPPKPDPASVHPFDAALADIHTGDEHPHTAALRKILAGSRCSGRWLIEEGDHAGECPNGYDEHDESTEPPGCYWEEYDAEEQARWLSTVTAFCEEALAVPSPPYVKPS